MRILIIEDNQALVDELKPLIQKAGYVVDHCLTGIDGQHFGQEESYDCIILDLGLPDKSGLEVLAAWRTAANTVPVIILTARNQWHEKVEGFKVGADDYLGKPFHPEELLARIQAVIARSHGKVPASLNYGGISIDEDHQSAQAQGQEYTLTAMEYRLLKYMIMNPEKLLSKTRLTEHLYEYDDDKDSNVLEVYVNYLRKKFGKGCIETKRGQGYIFKGIVQ